MNRELLLRTVKMKIRKEIILSKRIVLGFVVWWSFLNVDRASGLSLTNDLSSALARLQPNKLRRRLQFTNQSQLLNIHNNSSHSHNLETPNSSSSLYQVPRAGGLNSNVWSGADESDDGSIVSRFGKIDKEKLGMTVALFCTYFTVMGAKCALPSTLSLLTDPKTGLSFQTSQTVNPQQSMAKLLSLSTFTISFGKILLGPWIDTYGGVFCLKVALALLALCLGIVSSAVQFSTFAVAWILVDFTFSSCWGACLNAIHQSFTEQEWSSKIGTLATAARTGNTVSFLTFASILQLAPKNIGIQPWRMVFMVASVVQIIPLVLLSIFGGRKKGHINNLQTTQSNTACTTDSRSISDALSVVGKESQKLEFWFHFVNRSVQMVLASFLLFVPSYMSNCFGMSPSSAASVGSIYALGCLLAISFGSQKYTSLTKRGKIASNVAMTMSLLLVSVLNFCHVSGMLTLAPIIGTVCMFLWGLSFAIPFYIPASMYALTRGGQKSSATIADMFDFGGFTLLALFNGYVAGINQTIKSSWAMTYVILFLCSLISMISLTFATLWDS